METPGLLGKYKGWLRRNVIALNLFETGAPRGQAADGSLLDHSSVGLNLFRLKPAKSTSPVSLPDIRPLQPDLAAARPLQRQRGLVRGAAHRHRPGLHPE